ncbi:hypothetical protein QCA50_016571 [Cerrena zonata]|uniref:Protein kinase domain-containing protein n=1 Tax=Cerrena zonata TaxID=2478898 RepID=A0AAW0FIC8_9APHY
MQKILDDPSEHGLEAHRYTLRRFLIRLSRDSGFLPSSLFLNAVVDIDRDPFGGGAFADIFLAKHNGKAVALKRLRMFQYSTDQQKKDHVKNFFREALMWRQLSHPHILPFLGVDKVTFPGHFCMVAPFMQNGNIIQCAEYFLQIGADVPREPWLLEIGKGLQYLHEEQLVHGDLRGANILIDEDLHVRLADFGVAVLADASSSSGISTRSGGAARWCPPEVLKGEPSSFESDIYAFGCVCIELYTLDLPFPELNDAQVVAKILKGFRPKRPSPETGIQLYIWSLARRCWTVKSSRPDIANVIDSLANQRIIPLTVPPRSPPASPKRVYRHHASSPSNTTLAELAELATSDDGHSFSIASTPSALSPFFPPSLDHSPKSIDFVKHGRSRSTSPREGSSPPRAGVPRMHGPYAGPAYSRTPQISPGGSSEEFEIVSPRSSFETDESNVFHPVVL